MKTFSEHFLGRVEAFLPQTGAKASEFGRQTVGDPSFVANLRRGRSPNPATAAKVIAYIVGLETETIQRPTKRNLK